MIRPLDPLGSIKTKLGVLVAVTVAVAATLSVLGVRAGFWPRYTIPAAVLVALVVTQVLARGMTFDFGDDDLAAYIATGEPMDKAGAYAIQGIGVFMVLGVVLVLIPGPVVVATIARTLGLHDGPGRPAAARSGQARGADVRRDVAC